MNPRPMYGFLAGLFLLLVGYSLLQSGNRNDLTKSYIGIAVLILGGLLIAGSLIWQARQRSDK